MKAIIGGRKTEGGGRKAEGGRWKAEGGGRKTEAGGRRAESGRRKAEGGGRSSLPSPLSPLPSSRRRGVLLLVVLALLAIFALVGVAFVVLTSQAQRSAVTFAQIEQGTDPSQPVPAQKLLQQVMMQILHGSTSNASPIGAGSLLEDMYGNGWVSGSVSTATSVTGFQQLINISVASPLTRPDGSQVTAASNPSLAAEVARRGGCVLTITNQYRTGNQPNPLYGLSTRIVGITLGSAVIQVVAFPAIDPTTGQPILPQQYDQFVINSAAFSGTGRGFNADGTLITGTAGTASGPLALLPNSPDIRNRNPPGGANPDYTAPDFQHVLLAAQVPNSAVTGGIQTLPSMQRPALCNYWANVCAPGGGAAPNPSQTANTIAAAQAIPSDLKRAIIFRPLPEDHPDFTGSNPTYQPIDQTVPKNLYKTGFNPCWDGRNTIGQAAPPFSYDVDNDGDGMPDSVWLDLGMPVRQTADGRLYKPLFAILCVDLDGRLNLNAHGSLAQLDTSAAISPTGDTATDDAVRGQGFGPAEVKLGTLLGTTAYQQVLTGGTVNGTYYEGRYGSRKLPGTTNLDAVYGNKWFDYGQSYWSFATSPTATVNDAGSYGSPPDPFGVGSVTLDTGGRPVYKWTTTGKYGFGSGISNTPYQLNLGPDVNRGLTSSANNQNNPFSPSEMERLLRPYDRDALMLPGRLAALAPLAPITARLDVTTESWDWPGLVTPSTGIASADPLRAQVTARVTDLLKQRLVTAGVAETTALQLLSQVLPPEVFVGLKMDINRPFGNGRDYSANPGDNPATSGIIDAPVVPPVPKQVPLAVSGGTTSVQMSYDAITVGGAGMGAQTLAANPLQARQLEARYLYVLVFALANRTKLVEAFNNDPEQAARAVAQWAVNAVDFRDRDGIMTPFDYDPNYAYNDAAHSIYSSAKKSIWNPPGDYSHRVWGCKRPELLISETLAFHDRRTQDTDTEYDAATSGENDSKKKAFYYNNGGTHDTSMDYDISFDQSYRPQGSLFVELHNPSSPWEPQSGDLYSAPNGKAGLSLSQWSGTISDLPSAPKYGPSPVWRLLVASNFKGAASGASPAPVLDPDDPDPTKWPTIEREVYFVSLAPTGPTKITVPLITLTGAKVQYYPNTTPANATIPPGGYAVIGPGEVPIPNTKMTYQNGHPNRTYIGFLVGGTAGTSTTRYIDLDAPNASGTATLPVQNNINSPPDPTSPSLATTVDTPVMLAINSPWRLSISEPIRLSGTVSMSVYDDYEAKALGAITTDTNGKYVKKDDGSATAFDIPFDKVRDTDDADTKVLKGHLTTNHTESAFRMIYLQRLANPLKPYNNTWGSVDYNPYRTIDCMAADLTVFNGVTDKVDPDSGKDDIANFHFEARQRGEGNDTVDANGINQHMNLWTQEPWQETSWKDTNPASHLANGHYFTPGLKHSLGYLNQAFGAPAVNGTTGEKGLPSQTTVNQYGTFPWLTWNQRPYVSPLELTLVPWVSSSQLLGQYGLAQPQQPAGVTGTTNPYSTPTSTLPSAPLPPFPHLMNLFVSGIGSTPNEELHRVLEYLDVPSPFVGTETWANPTMAANSTGHAYHPPFNRLSAYREPGRINLNTLYGDVNAAGVSQQLQVPPVWQGLMAGYPGMNTTTAWQEFVASRRGGSGAAGTKKILDPADVTVPTEFAHPFRSFVGASLVPNLPGSNPLQPVREIDVTLLREPPPGGGGGPVPPGGSTTTSPLFLSTSAAQYNDTSRNPYFHYQGLQRLGNLVTTRSNVFAVWITVGYFEVEPAAQVVAKLNPTWSQTQIQNQVQAVYPDGYALSRELGIDTGEVNRHRAFYIIDRTLPVGFQRGQDLNSDKAILVNRFIE